PPASPPTVPAAPERPLKPRTPADCPACRQAGATATAPPPSRISLTPWRERKSRRGAAKRILTQRFACPNRTCLYYQITDAHIHALVGDGAHGQHERRETLRCQACGTTFSTRRNTPLYRLKTASHRVAEVLTALAEGLSVAAAVRVFGHQHATITTWLTYPSAHSMTMHERVNLTLRQSVAALIRRTWSTMQEAPQLLMHLEWWRAYYHFVRPHESLRGRLEHPPPRGGHPPPQRDRPRAPALGGRLSQPRWTGQGLPATPPPP